MTEYWSVKDELADKKPSLKIIILKGGTNILEIIP